MSPKKLGFERSTFGPGYSETRGLVLCVFCGYVAQNGTETQNFIVGIGSMGPRLQDDRGHYERDKFSHQITHRCNWKGRLCYWQGGLYCSTGLEGRGATTGSRQRLHSLHCTFASRSTTFDRYRGHAGNLDNGVPRICEEDGCALTFVRCEEDREHQEPDEECCPQLSVVITAPIFKLAWSIGFVITLITDRGAVALPTGTAANHHAGPAFARSQMLSDW